MSKLNSRLINLGKMPPASEAADDFLPFSGVYNGGASSLLNKVSQAYRAIIV